MSASEAAAFVSQARRGVNKLFYRGRGLCFNLWAAYTAPTPTPTPTLPNTPSVFFFSSHNAKLGVVTRAPANICAGWRREWGGEARSAAASHGDPQLRRHRIALTYITLCQNMYFWLCFICSQLEGENTRGLQPNIAGRKVQTDTSRRAVLFN